MNLRPWHRAAVVVIGIAIGAILAPSAASAHELPPATPTQVPSLFDFSLPSFLWPATPQAPQAPHSHDQMQSPDLSGFPVGTATPAIASLGLAGQTLRLPPLPSAG